MKKILVVFLFTAIISFAFGGIYLSSLADARPDNECPYLKNKSETNCPYLEDKCGKTESKCPYINGEMKCPANGDKSEPNSCPYLNYRHSLKKNYMTIKNISS